jgi:hypothetical protein
MIFGISIQNCIRKCRFCQKKKFHENTAEGGVQEKTAEKRAEGEYRSSFGKKNVFDKTDIF